MVRGRGLITLVAGAALVAGVAAATPAASAAPTAGTATAAPGAPGAPSYFDLARKDCLGTAANRGSKVWYTVADGVLSDVYEPTIDNTDVSTLQYVVTDGATFTDLQTRDMTYTVAADPTGMSCTVTSTDAKHGFRLVTTYITDPASDTVLMNTRLQDLPGSGANLAGLHLYARLDAHVNGNGGGGSANAGANSGVVDTSTGRRSRWSSARTPSPTPPTGTTRCRPTWRWPAVRAGGERRLRGHRQRRPHPAGHRAYPDRLHLRAGRPRGGHRERDPGPRPRGDPRAGLRPDPGAVGLRRRGLAEPPVRPDRGEYLLGWAGYDAGLPPPARRGQPGPLTTTCRPTC